MYSKRGGGTPLAKKSLDWADMMVSVNLQRMTVLFHLKTMYM